MAASEGFRERFEAEIESLKKLRHEGIVRLYGWGVPQDQRKGIAWIRRAAEQGHASAETDLGFAYTQGTSVEKDLSKARALFENMLACRNHVGLLSEDLDPKTNELWGNFPQTYSMVGIINSAMRLSKSWEQAF